MGRFEFEGYSFDTAKEMDIAKKEAESIEYIKAKMELKDREKARKLYDSLIEKKTFVTPIGINFMMELNKDLSMFSIKPLEGVPVHLPLERIKAGEGKLTKGLIHNSNEKSLKQSDIYKDKLKNSRIINVFLVILVLAMFAVVLFGDNSPFVDAEKKIQDKYATWEEQLNEKEQLLQEREQQLNSME